MNAVLVWAKVEPDFDRRMRLMRFAFKCWFDKPEALFKLV